MGTIGWEHTSSWETLWHPLPARTLLDSYSILCKDIGWIHTSSWVSLGKTSPARSHFAVLVFMAGVLAGYTCNISSGLCLDAHHATIYASSWVILVIPTSIEVL